MAKIFIGIALVITLVTAALGFMAKGNIEKMRDTLKEAGAVKNKAEGNLQVAKTELKKAQDDVAAAKTAVDEKDKEVAAKTAQVDTLMKDSAAAKTALEDKDKQIADLTAKVGTPAPPLPTGPDPAACCRHAKARGESGSGTRRSQAA